jgi:hypothetical protein
MKGDTCMVYCVETQKDGFVGLCKVGEQRKFFTNYFSRDRVEEYLRSNGYSAVDLIMFNDVDYKALSNILVQSEIETYERMRDEIRAGKCSGSNFYSGNFHFYFDYD